METIGTLIAGAVDQAAAKTSPEAKPRVHRVTLCVMTFAEIDVSAVDAARACQLAVEHAKDAKRTFRTMPAAHRVRVEERVDWRRPELGMHWVDVEKAR